MFPFRRQRKQEEPEEDEAPPVEVPHSQTFLVGLSLVLLVVALLIVWPYLAAVVIAVVIGYLMHPLQRRLVRVVRKRSLAAAINLLLVTLVAVLPFVFIGASLVDQAAAAAEILGDRARLEATIADFLGGFGVEREQAQKLVGNVASGIGNAAQGVAIGSIGRVAHFFGGLLVFYILLFFVLRDGDRMVTVAHRLLPLRRQAADHLLQLSGERVRAIVLGTFLVAIIQGVVAGLGWWFFGLPAPVFWGFVMTVIAVLPFGAPFLVMIPASLYLLAQGNIFGGVGMLVWTAVVVGLIDDVLRPYIVGRRSGVHPAIILLGTLGGIVVFGVTGFVLGPLILSMLEPVLVVWAQERQRLRAQDAGPSPPAS